MKAAVCPSNPLWVECPCAKTFERIAVNLRRVYSQLIHCMRMNTSENNLNLGNIHMPMALANAFISLAFLGRTK